MLAVEPQSRWPRQSIEVLKDTREPRPSSMAVSEAGVVQLLLALKPLKLIDSRPRCNIERSPTVTVLYVYVQIVP